MLAVSVPVAVPQQMPHIVLIIAACVVVRTLVRLVLCGLAVLATHRALGDSENSQKGTEAVRAHHLAVLQAILAALTHARNPPV